MYESESGVKNFVSSLGVNKGKFKRKWIFAKFKDVVVKIALDNRILSLSLLTLSVGMLGVATLVFLFETDLNVFIKLLLTIMSVGKNVSRIVLNSIKVSKPWVIYVTSIPHKCFF